ncbi:enolase 4 isoform X1 [Acanthochromis polyacanthus]|uniref:enolase 4 isoform X1 n=1 Tax=Acanthochromis polyacanthus TaxID=80966 RepID=UPI0022348BCC|nr:enolase 4 isoform X1 [Acanthochromis polyacanthus]
MSSQGSVSRQSKEEQDLYEMKKAAAEFYRVNRVPQEIERALGQLLLLQPQDLYGYLADYFTNLSAPPRISRLKGREVYDASGQLSIEAEVFCIVCNKEKSMSSAAVSSHSAPMETSLDWKAKSQERVDHVVTAVQWINEPLNSMLKDQNPCAQSEIDHILSSFFMARYLEEKTRNRENSCSPSQPEVVAPSPTPMQTKEKKNADKVKKSNMAEKPFVPAEPSEPVLHGSLAIGSLSLAVVKTGAQIQGIPLYKYIAALTGREAPTQFHIPASLVTLLSCGKTSPGKLNLLKEVILIPKMGQGVKQIITMTLELQKEMMRIVNSSTKAGAPQAVVCDSGAPTVSYERPEQPLDLITEACSNLELTLGTDIHLAVNCAAHELMDYSKGKYEVATGVLKSPDELADMYQTLICKYPAVVALIDPFRREDADQWERLSKATGHTCSLISDITYKSQAPPLPGVRGFILKPVNETTVSDLICITSKHKGSVLMGTTSSEPCNEESLSDIAVGLGLDYVILGGLSGAQRMLKYNRLISIEEELAQQGILVSKEKHPLRCSMEKPRSRTERTV